MNKIMNKTMRKSFKLLSICLLSAILFQGCAVYAPKQPVQIPPPVPEGYPPPPPAVPKPPTPQTEPTIEAPAQVDTIAANFSRQAQLQTSQGQTDLAAATLERGLRAAPKDAGLWSQLAEIKLQQKQYLQARSLAAKSNSLAGSNTSIMQKNYWIIEESLRKAAEQ
jgi:tetratricopeptide (TPR) repeat protein